jgi:hypothetical protein
MGSLSLTIKQHVVAIHQSPEFCQGFYMDPIPAPFTFMDGRMLLEIGHEYTPHLIL